MEVRIGGVFEPLKIAIRSTIEDKKFLKALDGYYPPRGSTIEETAHNLTERSRMRCERERNLNRSRDAKVVFLSKLMNRPPVSRIFDAIV
jgi:hypothetical protein